MNPEARSHLRQGIVKSFEAVDKDRHVDKAITKEAVKAFETALSLGLSPDDEMQARFFLGESYSHSVDAQGSAAELLESPELSQAINQMEKAVALDSQGNYGYFTDAVNRARLQRLDMGYVLVGESIKEIQGANAAISYYRDKLQLLDHLPSTPLLTVLLRLGLIYTEPKDYERASECFRRILNADTVDPTSMMEAQNREHAENFLRLIASEREKKSSCFIATAVYGEATPELEAFRNFRDDTLLKTFMGRVFVSSYYSLSPRVANLIRKSELSRQLTRTVLLRPILSLIKLHIKR